jgi:signal transduction protein with GAF and PtsI domain
MLTRLREIVEKVASAPRLNEALDILVTDICLRWRRKSVRFIWLTMTDAVIT